MQQPLAGTADGDASLRHVQRLVPRSLVLLYGDARSKWRHGIVNTANRHLEVGDGINGAIRHAVGPELLRHCRALGGCDVGRAVVTRGFRLTARWVIHTVAPKWTGGTRGEPVLLESCYRESLACADEVGAESVAFPAIATGAPAIRWRQPPRPP